MLRPDVGVTDLPMISLMLGTVVEVSRDDDPELYRRYLELLLSALRAEPAPPTELHPPLPLAVFQAAVGRAHQRPRRP